MKEYAGRNFTHHGECFLPVTSHSKWYRWTNFMVDLIERPQSPTGEQKLNRWGVCRNASEFWLDGNQFRIRTGRNAKLQNVILQEWGLIFLLRWALLDILFNDIMVPWLVCSDGPGMGSESMVCVLIGVIAELLAQGAETSVDVTGSPWNANTKGLGGRFLVLVASSWWMLRWCPWDGSLRIWEFL